MTADFNQMDDDATSTRSATTPQFVEIMKAGHPGPLAMPPFGPAMPASRPSRSSVSIRPLISSDAASSSLRAIAWSRSRSPGPHPRGRW